MNLQALGIRHWALGGLVAVMIGCLSSANGYADDTPTPRLISVTGEAEKTYEPDKVDITLALEGSAETLADAKQNHDKMLKGLHKLLERYEVEKRDIKTLSNNIAPRYGYHKENKKRILAGYSATHRVQISFTQLDKIGDLINDITAIGIDQLQQMSFGLKDSSGAEREVMLMAVKDARAKADAVAQTLGISAPKVHSVNVQNGGGYHPRSMPLMARAEGMSAADSAMAAEIPAGDVKISKTVNAQFEITN